MARNAQIIGQAIDVFGIVWDVRERRPTKHRWRVQIGWPQDEDRGQGGRGVAVILTQPLAHYVSTTRMRDMDLPISATARKRAERERKRESGLVRVEVWVRPEHAQRVREYAAGITAPQPGR